jgi:flagellar basal body-associated protein FliL
MAKTIAAPNAVEDKPQKKSGKKPLLIAGAVGLLAVIGGAAMPMCFKVGAQTPAEDHEPSHKSEPRQALVPFDAVVVNVADGRYTRYLRVKITFVVDAKDETKVKEVVEKEKPFLQTWVLGYLQDRTMEQLHGSAGMNRVRREVGNEFNRRLFPDGSEKIKDILLTEYNFQ